MTERQTDVQTDGQTSCHGIVRVMHTRRAVKTRTIIRPNTWLVQTKFNKEGRKEVVVSVVVVFVFFVLVLVLVLVLVIIHILL